MTGGLGWDSVTFFSGGYNIQKDSNALISEQFRVGGNPTVGGLPPDPGELSG